MAPCPHCNGTGQKQESLLLQLRKRKMIGGRRATQAEVAKASDMNQATYSRLEKRGLKRSYLAWSKLEKMAKYFGVTIEQLKGNEPIGATPASKPNFRFEPGTPFEVSRSRVLWPPSKKSLAKSKRSRAAAAKKNRRR